jgi:serine/threonine protein kinase
VSAYHENALEPGSSLAEYTIERVLGHGGFGITYLARDTTLGSFVAIKEYLPPEIATRNTRGAMVIPRASRDAIKQYHWGLRNFVKEARALARFKHPNIVRVLRFIEANGTAYMVMEYEEGQTLAQRLKHLRQRLDEPGLFRTFMPILNGLHAVHEARLLHLDIKPENIYLRRDGNPMLIDFGSARQAMSAGAQSARITLTHGYAPIEQYPDKGSLGPWSDVYAIGATMYRCVTGKRPQDSIERYRAVLDYKVDPLRPAQQAGAKHYPAALLECIDWAMQIYAKDRPQSARALQDGLMSRRGARRAATPAAGPGAAAAGQRLPGGGAIRARRGATGAVVLGLALAAVAWFAWPTIVDAWQQLLASWHTLVPPVPRP